MGVNERKREVCGNGKERHLDLDGGGRERRRLKDDGTSQAKDDVVSNAGKTRTRAQGGENAASLSLTVLTLKSWGCIWVELPSRFWEVTQETVRGWDTH